MCLCLDIVTGNGERMANRRGSLLASISLKRLLLYDKLFDYKDKTDLNLRENGPTKAPLPLPSCAKPRFIEQDTLLQ